MKVIQTAYVGGPIDLASNEAIKTRESTINMLKSSGITVYNPATAFYYGGDGEKAVKTINEFAISQCDVVLLIYIPGVVTIGTPIEMQIAKDFDKTLIVVSPWSPIPIYIKALADYIFEEVTSAAHFIIKCSTEGFPHVNAQSSITRFHS